jgi:hypothetical protein
MTMPTQPGFSGAIDADPDQLGMLPHDNEDFHGMLEPADAPDVLFGLAHDGDPSLYGTPDHDALFWRHQTTDFTCAVQAQASIIHDFTGREIGECRAAVEATMHGWLTPHGTSPDDVGRLLEQYGVPCHSASQATVGDLISELALGHKVIVGVHAGDLWYPERPDVLALAGDHADHAIWVTGVDLSDPNRPMVIINDSGAPDGAGKAYDLRQFVDAWSDSGFFYVATDQAPPHLAERVQGYNEQQGVFTALVDFLGAHVPDFTIAGASLAVGHVVGEMVGNDMVGTLAHTATHLVLNSLLSHREAPNALPPPSLATMSRDERDRLFHDI